MSATAVAANEQWRSGAACTGKGHLPFTRKASEAQKAEARQVCHGCPVRAECLAFALSAPGGSYGIWGGFTLKGTHGASYARKWLARNAPGILTVGQGLDDNGR